MARYRMNLRDLELALRGLGVPIASTAADNADRTVEIELEPLPSSSFAAVRSEPLREPLEALVRQGLSNRAIATELNDRGEFGPNGGLWHSSSIKRLRSRLGV